jgi:hypothetical protein
MAARFPDGALFQGTVTLADVTIKPGITRGNMAQQSAAQFASPWESWRVHDAYQTILPGTAASDDVGLIGGVFGTGCPSIQTSDAKATTVTQYARAVIRMPIEYDAATNVSLMFHAGMKTTASDGTATLAVEAYLSDKEGLVDGADKVTTAATTINSLTLTDKTYALSAGSLSPGDVLDVKITVAITDTATPTAVLGWIGGAWLQCDVRG